MRLEYECQIPFHRNEVDATAILGLDGAGRPGLISVELHVGPAGSIKFNKGQKFDRTLAYLRAVHWSDILLQFELRRQEIADLADRFERLQPTSPLQALVASARASELRAVAAQAVRVA